MKTNSNHFVSPVNSFFAFFKAKKAGISCGSDRPDKGSLAITREGIIEEGILPETSADKKDGLNFSEFQRKAHIGNFFAGPSCVFDPRLFK